MDGKKNLLEQLDKRHQEVLAERDTLRGMLVDTLAIVEKKGLIKSMRLNVRIWWETWKAKELQKQARMHYKHEE